MQRTRFRNSSRRQAAWGGFTAVEMLVTLALLGLVLAFGLASMDSSSWRLDAAADQVVQRLRLARSLAVLRQYDVIVTFDQTNPAVIVHEDANGDGAVDEGERVFRYPLEEGTAFTRGAGPAYGGFDVGSISFPDGTVTFHRNGSSSSEGAVYVGRGPDDVRPEAVIVERATGYAKRFKFDGNSWVRK